MESARRRLKADLHVHSGDDPYDAIPYSAEMLVDAVSQLNVDVLALACHNRVVHTPRLAAHARERGVLLVPAAELMIDGRHVLILNPDEEQARARSFGELRRLGKRDACVIAPHPYYPEGMCLGAKLVENIDLFDAIEWSSLYLPGLNPNRKALRVARQFGLPCVGTSDSHTAPYSDNTFSWLDVEEVSVPGVLEALRAGRVEVETRPPPWRTAVTMAFFVSREKCRQILGRRKKEVEPP